MAEKFGLKNMNKKYNATLSLNEPVSFNLTSEGLDYFKNYLKDNKNNFDFSLNVDYKYSSSLELLIEIFGDRMFVGSIPLLKDNSIFIDSLNQKINLNDRIYFNINEYANKYLNDYVKKQKEVFKLDFERTVKKNDSGELYLTFHEFWYMFQDFLRYNKVGNKNITPNNLIRIEHQC